MMRRIIIFAMMILVIVSFVSAKDLNSESIVPVEIKVGVDFQDTTDFRLMLPGGFERHFYWDKNETHSDVTFNHTVYKEIKDDEWCSHYKVYAEDCRDMNSNLTQMLTSCATVVDNLEYQEKKDKAVKDAAEYEKMWSICEDNRKDAVNDSDECQDELEECQSKEERCDSQLTTYKSNAKDCSECKEELEDCKKSKSSGGIIWFVAGFAACYFLFGKKKGSGPSEQAESGSVSDRVRQPEERMKHDPTEFQKRRVQRPYDDGPRD